jgi:NAD(P)H-nitrite reductase large subunit
MMKEKLVVIGNGMAPGRVLERLFEPRPTATQSPCSTPNRA